MAFWKYAVWSTIALASATLAFAQQKFPLNTGEWEVTIPVPIAGQPPMKMLYCLNDAMWEKALTQNPSCKISDVVKDSSGASYAMDCQNPSYKMSGKVRLEFAGKDHMTGKSTMEIIRDGKTTSMTSTSDWRWKTSACSPNDANMKDHKAAQ